MKQFKDFNIKELPKSFIGDKIKMNKILNKSIIVQDYKITETKFDKTKGSGKYLTMQIAIGENNHVVFTGSSGLIQTITQVEKEDMPFTTTIVENNDRFEFT